MQFGRFMDFVKTPMGLATIGGSLLLIYALGGKKKRS
jgi:hypothetical protein